ncbi:MAG: hypothetical protein EAZ32_00845 [Cytophagia bacterium]|nr:MAG: hypothetical protein EAZ46_13160 [Runella sp.]TAG23425.1 MAG: hypothetical protein EAZ38_03350 [Cytophagales bacterium]TAG42612.1 MAG: hypothetical protein EAZ32_00845 [Cytophagia bacterium]TAG58613.1 MAG: hypothetical protein EAZ29_00690 [Runella slithyformis]TAG76301.1 MAG: hypothetical protein EAZ22_18500 [Cytophagales bacterium]
MTATPLKTQVYELVERVDELYMEDLLRSIKLFLEQRQTIDFDDASPEIMTKLQQSLVQANEGTLVSNEEMKRQTKLWLTK